MRIEIKRKQNKTANSCLLRYLYVFIGALSLLTSSFFASAAFASDTTDQTRTIIDLMEQEIRQCLETIIEEELTEEPFTTGSKEQGNQFSNISYILAGNCIGIETRKCFAEVDPYYDLYYHHCVRGESKAWQRIRRYFFSQLLNHTENAISNQITKELLVKSDDTWQKSRIDDCDYLARRLGHSINIEYQGCISDKEAYRAIWYRLWFYDLQANIGE